MSFYNRFIDPGFYSHQAVTRIAGNALLRIADSLILPFSLSRFADFVQLQVDATEREYEVKMIAEGISLGKLLSVLNKGNFSFREKILLQKLTLTEIFIKKATNVRCKHLTMELAVS